MSSRTSASAASKASGPFLHPALRVGDGALADNHAAKGLLVSWAYKRKVAIATAPARRAVDCRLESASQHNVSPFWKAR
ncbi:MAG: hypothetical protein DMG70_12305 [Acidobacteria bacterium]|nr:MAG: hypothetical protein DMG70_12305 [Acidobacteriota bacterium]PYY10691.1 MAG: hypothetical protein DMG69_05930 [Acidobacteriota bacterium]